MPQELTPRFIKIRKNYLTLVNNCNILQREVDTKRKAALKSQCSRIQLNCQLLLELASDLSDSEKEMLKEIKEKPLP
jgi:hypothetical protein